MTKSSSSTSSQIVIGYILILLGALFLLQTLHLLDFGHVLATWWPVILLVIGFMKIKGDDKKAGTIIFCIGIILLSGTLDFIHWSSILRFWPLILILIGFSMVQRLSGREGSVFSRQVTVDKDATTVNAMFGRVTQSVSSQNFKGGEVLAIFGGAVLDLRKAALAESGCTLHCTALFGGIEIYVPDDVSIRTTGFPVFGGIDNKVPPPADPEQPRGEIVLHCTVAFGGIDISR